MSTLRKPTGNEVSMDVLAWELIATARPYLSRSDADRIYISLGIGETFASIEASITLIALHRIPIGDDLAANTAGWLDRYLGHDGEPRLRQLLTDIVVASSQDEMSTACGRADAAASDANPA